MRMVIVILAVVWTSSAHAVPPVPSPPADAKPKPKPPSDDESLDRAAIAEGIANVKPKIAACGDGVKAGGTIKVRVVVSGNGRVTSATRAGTGGDAKLGACVLDAIKTATFKKTAKGGAFSYPFFFGGTPASPPAGGPPAAKPPTDPPPTGLDRAAISAGIAKVRSRVVECGKTTKVKGTVKVRVEVTSSGTVGAATVQSTPDAALGACVATALKAATFAKTTGGGTFTYPFVF